MNAVISFRSLLCTFDMYWEETTRDAGCFHESSAVPLCLGKHESLAIRSHPYMPMAHLVSICNTRTSPVIADSTCLLLVLH